MNGIIEFVKVNAKAIAAFVVGIILNAIQAVVNGQAPWPHTLKDWGIYLGTSLVAGVAVWATGNKLTTGQVIKGAVQQGVTIIANNTIDKVADAAVGAVHEATTSSFLPDGVATPINDVAQQVSDTVTNVLKGFADNIIFPAVDLKNVL